MSEDKVVPFRQKDEIDDPLTEILRAGAKRLIEQAVEAEFAAFLGSHGDLTERGLPADLRLVRASPYRPAVRNSRI